MKTIIKISTAVFMTLIMMFGLAAGSVSAGAVSCVENTDGVRVVNNDGFQSASTVSAFNTTDTQAVSDTDAATEWKTVSYTPDDLSQSGKNTTYTVSAKGNEIKIVIKSDYINGDKLYCEGTKTAPESPLYDKADGINIFEVWFSDTDSKEPNTNHLSLYVSDSCGENKNGHYISASKDATYALYYNFYEEDGTNYLASVGQHYDSKGNLQMGDYYGKKSECKKLNISISGDTMTVTTTLPSEVVDYYNESKRELKFDSENLIVSGGSQIPYYVTGEVSPENTDIVNKIITKIKEVWEKFLELLRKFFTFDF